VYGLRVYPDGTEERGIFDGGKLIRASAMKINNEQVWGKVVNNVIHADKVKRENGDMEYCEQD
jgi:hypothetical protein